jgi:hypothetical protein
MRLSYQKPELQKAVIPAHAGTQLNARAGLDSGMTSCAVKSRWDDDLMVGRLLRLKGLNGSDFQLAFLRSNSVLASWLHSLTSVAFFARSTQA